MIETSTLSLSGAPHIVVTDCNGVVKHDFTVKNMVVTTGKVFFVTRALGAADAPMSHMAVGSSAATVVAADNMLGAELARVALTSATNTDNTITYIAFFAPGVGTGAITEAGIFNADTAGIMLNRATFPVINKSASDSMTITWNVTVN